MGVDNKDQKFQFDKDGINKIYQEYLQKIKKIEKERDDKIMEILNRIEKRKIDNLTDDIKNK